MRIVGGWVGERSRHRGGAALLDDGRVEREIRDLGCHVVDRHGQWHEREPNRAIQSPAGRKSVDEIAGGAVEAEDRVSFEAAGVQISVRTENDIDWAIQAAAGGHKRGQESPGDAVESEDAVVVVAGDIEVAVRPERESAHVDQLGIAGKHAEGRAGGPVVPENRIVVLCGHVQVAIRAEGDFPGKFEPSAPGRDEFVDKRAGRTVESQDAGRAGHV